MAAFIVGAALEEASLIPRPSSPLNEAAEAADHSSADASPDQVIAAPVDVDHSEADAASEEDRAALVDVDHSGSPQQPKVYSIPGWSKINCLARHNIFSFFWLLQAINMR